jgi:putative oxidoreductase
VDRSRLEDAGKLVLRVAIGALILLHGIAKIRHGLGDVATSLARVHAPAAIGYLVYVGEVVAPLMMIAGVAARVGALLVFANMTVAFLLGHPGEAFELTMHGGLLLEVQWLYLLGALAVAFLGAGRYSLVRGHWN